MIVAPDSFKECLRAEEVAEAMAAAVLDVFPEAEVVQMPLADGGEGKFGLDMLLRGNSL